jgi:hypothetical protein
VVGASFFSLPSHGMDLFLSYVFVIVANKKEIHFIKCTSSILLNRSVFASYLQALVQESAFSQVAQVSATQVSALQQESTATQHVSAFSHVVSLHFLLQHELMVRAATATITNNTFFIFFA